ncbi:MAG: hypothetical protein HZB79_04780 [Deltaproteobacteria bacterium]|nr:hypothetical protein [Deltaproteobacteria bacterium]
MDGLFQHPVRHKNMANIIAMIIGGVAGYLPHLIFGSRMSFFTDFMAGSIVGGAAYVYAVYKIKNM